MAADPPRMAAGQGGRLQHLLKIFGLQTLDLGLRSVQQIIAVPVLIRQWGTAVYQDWIVLFAAASFLLIVDCGMQTYFVNALLIARIEQDRARYRRLISVAMALYVAVLAVAGICIVAFVASGYRAGLLGVRTMDDQTVAMIAVLLGVAILSLIPLGVFTGIYRIRGNYDLSVLVGMLTQTAPGFGLCLLAYLGGSPVQAAAIYAFAALLAWTLVAIDQRRRYGEFPLALARPTRCELGETVSHALQYMVSGVAAPVILNGPVLLLGALGASGSVIPYVTTRTLVGLIRQIVIQSAQPIGIELARLYGQRNLSGVRALFGAAIRLASGGAGLLSGFLLIVADPLLRLWTHGQVHFDPWLVAIFAINVMGVAPAQVAFAFLSSVNQPRPLVISTACFTGLAVVLGVLFIRSHAADGAAFAFGLAEILCVGLFVPYVVCRRIGFPVASCAAITATLAPTGLLLGYGAAWLLTRLIPVESFTSLLLLSICWSIAVAVPAYGLLLTRSMQDHLKRGLGQRTRA